MSYLIEEYNKKRQEYDRTDINTDKKYLNKKFNRKLQSKQIELILFNTKSLDFEYESEIMYVDKKAYLKDIFNHNNYIENNHFVPFKDYYLVYSINHFKKLDNDTKLKAIESKSRTFNKNNSQKKDFLIKYIENISIDNIQDLYNEYQLIDNKESFTKFRNDVTSIINDCKFHYEFFEFVEKQRQKNKEALEYATLNIQII